jgi:hypothetical protein
MRQAAARGVDEVRTHAYTDQARRVLTTRDVESIRSVYGIR